MITEMTVPNGMYHNVSIEHTKSPIHPQDRPSASPHVHASHAAPSTTKGTPIAKGSKPMADIHLLQGPGWPFPIYLPLIKT